MDCCDRHTSHAQRWVRRGFYVAAAALVVAGVLQAALRTTEGPSPADSTRAVQACGVAPSCDGADGHSGGHPRERGP